jgi:hypothetical protein
VRFGGPITAMTLMLSWSGCAHANSVTDLSTQHALITPQQGRLQADRSPLVNPFRLKDCMSNRGSGGFPVSYSDEHPRTDKWEESPEPGTSLSSL